LERFNVIEILIKLNAFVGSNCNNWTIARSGASENNRPHEVGHTHD